MNGVRWVLTGGMAVVLLAGCERIGSPLDIISGNRSKPDEFQVVTRKPLQMPNSLSLPEPRLGERSPLEHDPNADAVRALLGTSPGSGTGASAGERSLLSAANANADNSQIQTQVVAAEKAIDEARSDEIPTVLELVNGQTVGANKEALDPNREARRLQSSGVASAPVNPSDVPAEQEADAATAQGGTVFKPTGVQRRGETALTE